MGKIRTCPVCSQEFKPKGEYTNKKTGYTRKQKYCSKNCWNNRNPKAIKECDFCGTIFETYERETKKYCSMVCRNKGMVGRELSDDHKKNISKANKGFIPVNIFKKGKDHPFWIEDRNSINFTDTPEYNVFRKAILKRDDYTCQHCGGRGRAGYRPILEIHHIKSRKDFPELSLSESNCITLCKECHKKTDSYLNRWPDYTGKDPIREDGVKFSELIKATA